MKVKYIGEPLVALKHGKVYDVLAVENGYYRIMTEIGEDHLFPPRQFEKIKLSVNAGGVSTPEDGE